jgi:hypothetical protein
MSISRFLYTSAGGDVRHFDDDVLSDVKRTLVGRGLLQATVAGVAGASMGYAATYFGATPGQGCAAGSFWAALVFVMDAALIRGFPKLSVKAIPSLACRLAFALCAAFLVSLPVEVLVFNGPIERELAARDLSFAQNLSGQLDREFIQIDELRARIQARQQSLEPYRKDLKERRDAVIQEVEGASATRRVGEGPAYRQKQLALDAAATDLRQQEEAQHITNEADERQLKSLEAGKNAKRAQELAVQGRAHSLADRIEALWHLESERQGVGIPALALRLLLVLLELSPLLIKVTGRLHIAERATECADSEADELLSQRSQLAKKHRLQRLTIAEESQTAIYDYLWREATAAAKHTATMHESVVALASTMADQALETACRAFNSTARPATRRASQEAEDRLEQLFNEASKTLDRLHDAGQRAHDNLDNHKGDNHE